MKLVHVIAILASLALPHFINAQALFNSKLYIGGAFSKVGAETRFALTDFKFESGLPWALLLHGD